MVAVCTAGAFANIMYHRLKTLYIDEQEKPNIDEQEKPKEPQPPIGPILAWSKCEVVTKCEVIR